MAQFRSFEEIHAWQEGRILIREIRAICNRPKVKRDFAFIDQITRAARSICANIAEGCDAMTPPEFCNYLGIAKRSTAEVRSHLYDALDEEYLSQDEFTAMQDKCKKIQAMIAKLIHHLQSLDPDLKRTYSNALRVNESTNKRINVTP
ncbi:MAG: four helix bundle protein [Patescibacteria group bacterium]